MQQCKSIEELLLEEHSKERAQHIVQLVIENPGRMPELMECFFHKNIQICQRSAWSIGLLTGKHYNLLEPYLERMVDNLAQPMHNAVARNTYRTFQNINFPEELEGRIFDQSLKDLIDQQQPVAVRVFAMTVCANIALKYPELKTELITVIEEFLPYGSSGFRSRGSKLLKQLRKTN